MVVKKMSEILVQVSRGPLVENIIRGHIAVVDGQGEILASVGDVDYISYMRSAAKPLQASAVLEAGAIDAFDINDEQLAVMCGSHIGDDEHVRAVQGTLDKLGLDENAFTLGPSLSMSNALRERQLAAGIEPRKIFNNCSGKHSAMLALCRHSGWDISAYQRPKHPVQQLILKTIAAYTDYPADKIIIGVDGCGVPVFALPLRNMALSYCCLMNPELLPQERAAAARRITAAIAAHPTMTAGKSQFCSKLAAATKGRIIGKLGADGVYCLAPAERNLGVALKIEDGNTAMLAPVVMRVLEQLELLTTAETDALSRFRSFANINCRQEQVGETRAVFELKKPQLIDDDYTPIINQ